MIINASKKKRADWQMSGVRFAFSGSFSGNRFSLPISALFLTRVDYPSYSVLLRLPAPPPPPPPAEDWPLHDIAMTKYGMLYGILRGSEGGRILRNSRAIVVQWCEQCGWGGGQ